MLNKDFNPSTSFDAHFSYKRMIFSIDEVVFRATIIAHYLINLKAPYPSPCLVIPTIVTIRMAKVHVFSTSMTADAHFSSDEFTSLTESQLSAPQIDRTSAPFNKVSTSDYVVLWIDSSDTNEEFEYQYDSWFGKVYNAFGTRTVRVMNPLLLLKFLCRC